MDSDEIKEAVQVALVVRNTDVHEALRLAVEKLRIRHGIITTQN